MNSKDFQKAKELMAQIQEKEEQMAAIEETITKKGNNRYIELPVVTGEFIHVKRNFDIEELMDMRYVVEGELQDLHSKLTYLN